MSRPDPVIVEAEYRVIGENRWAPFRRWLTPKILWLLKWALWFAVMIPLTMALRPVVGGFRDLIDRMLFGL